MQKSTGYLSGTAAAVPERYPVDSRTRTGRLSMALLPHTVLHLPYTTYKEELPGEFLFYGIYFPIKKGITPQAGLCRLYNISICKRRLFGNPSGQTYRRKAETVSGLLPDRYLLIFLTMAAINTKIPLFLILHL